MPRLGIISDTHGLLRPAAMEFLRGCDRIIHAGDIGSAEVLARLSTVAPVTAVRGNNDVGDWADGIPETEIVEVNGTYVYVLHDLSLLDLDPLAAGIHVVVSGHSHKPSITRRDGVTYVNPGSAGARRFSLPIALAEVVVEGESVSARIVDLAIIAGQSGAVAVAAHLALGRS